MSLRIEFVKEANIIMRETDEQPVLVDFGAAGYEGAPRLTMRLPQGTPEYRSPEALRFRRVEQWRDRLLREGDGAIEHLRAEAPSVDCRNRRRVADMGVTPEWKAR